MSKVSVDAAALRQILVALNGPGHHIRELQATRNLPGVQNPIDKIIQDFNDNVATPCITVPIVFEDPNFVYYSPDTIYFQFNTLVFSFDEERLALVLATAQRWLQEFTKTEVVCKEVLGGDDGYSQISIEGITLEQLQAVGAEVSIES